MRAARRRVLESFRALLLVAAAAPAAGAAPAAPVQDSQRLIDQKPFDRVTLDKANEGKVLLTEPLDLPNRTIPQKPKPGEKLRVRLIAEPDKQYDILWRNIEKWELFEQMVLAEAERLVAERRYDDAFDYYFFLQRNYPDTPGLSRSSQAYLDENAAALAAQQRFAEALAVLEELHRLNPDYRPASGSETLLGRIGAAAEKLIAGYVDRGVFSSARSLITRLLAQFGDQQLPAVAKWRDRLMERAAAKLEEARQHLDGGRLREAYEASQVVLAIWPNIAGAAELVAEIAKRYPIVVVGVSQLAQIDDPTRLDNWPARRAGRLTHRLLFELIGPGPEGGQYDCPVGTASPSEDRQQLTIRLAQPPAAGGAAAASGYDIAQRILDLADPASPEHSPAWGPLLKEVLVEDVLSVRIDLRRPHVLPQSLLHIVLDQRDAPAKPSGYASYVAAKKTAAEVRFVANQQYLLARGGQPAEVVERVFAAPQQAMAALVRGDIDIIDRLRPADAARLKDGKTLSVKPYSLPTVHLLAPNYGNPFLASATFRRALVYGINRSAILQTVLLEGRELPGCRVISGPFPAAQSDNDASAYAYDERLKPHAYDPELAYLLARLGCHEVKAAAEKRGEKAPPLEPLVLGHPAAESPRVACQAIARQLEAIKVACRVKELPPGLASDPDGKCDLLYVEAAMWEPVVDAHRSLGPKGIAPAGGAYVALALRQLEAARNWKEVHECLKELHWIAHTEVVVIPLWQIVDYFAHQPRLEGVGERPAHLYQNIEQWRLAPRQP